MESIRGAACLMRDRDIVDGADRVIAIHVNNSRGTADSIRQATSKLSNSCVLVLQPCTPR